MNNLMKLLPLLMCVLLLSNCGKRDDDVSIWPNGDDLQILVQDQYTTLPAKVSIFFKVENNDGDPVAGLRNEDFTIFEKGKNDTEMRPISEDEALRQISPRRQVFIYNTLLVLDLSGSVSNNYLIELKEASKNFVDAVMPADNDGSVKMMIKWFDGANELHHLSDLSDDPVALKSAIESVDADISNDNSTDLYGAVVRAHSIVDQVLAQDADVNSAASIVLFTDGTDQAARYSKEEALNTVNGARETISFYTIGLGSEIDGEVLRRLGKNAFAFAENTNQLISVFEDIARRVTDEANSYYLFEYCSPKRDGAGMVELKLTVEKDGNAGEEITSFDATNFEGGCNL